MACRYLRVSDWMDEDYSIKASIGISVEEAMMSCT